MITVFFIGSGKLAHALVQAFKQTNVYISGLHSRNAVSGIKLAEIAECRFYKHVNEINGKEADVYFLAVPDAQISRVANQLNTNSIVLHCSGLTDILLLQHFENYGVFWPVQSFSEGISYNFKNIPVCIEANTSENLRIIEQLADKISGKVELVDSNKRKYMHLAAVFANNFTNHMYFLAEQIALKHHFDFKLLLPLIIETAQKLNVLSPLQAQTGPALRGDANTIEAHLSLLEKEPQVRQLYELISYSIQNNR